jgi:hypothetical protein
MAALAFATTVNRPWNDITNKYKQLTANQSEIPIEPAAHSCGSALFRARGDG